ncbi:MAG TPA: DUF4191 domain-containing protein [Nocardioides sp.]|uniref:DUF4191 domain-containing protein n=1 Tax=uncultured Nocardioides sp. TaxID=198441 RepID=UPI000EB8A88F|nr:DUF4191 domain-containing protein [uncultured Nocardioides sp.]HCB07923.1 DUF4191 domain-containing protein [Nocardioides sp.]HRD60160.1 DUF4191 domain-containing protein [Nocardioides sp.]HRI95711.1 DUF4191 domain-containing protein [Nocardioides sp.]HRK45597.1 DUF4191 domain-containing protein [Nocardioides sp.]
MAKEKTQAGSNADKTGRIQQFRETYRMSKKTDPRIGLWILGAFLLVGALGFVVFFVLLPTGDSLLGKIIAVVGALLFGTLAALIIFGRRAQRSAYSQMEGQPGAAAAALRMLRRGWRTDPAVAFTKQQDVVHRVIGPPGIVLIGEGNPNRVRTLLATERRKHERVVADVPVHEVICGNGEGEVPLPKLTRYVQKLGRSVKPAEMTDILNRIKALDAQRSTIPLPKGPVPTSMKGMRGNLRGR